MQAISKYDYEKIRDSIIRDLPKILEHDPDFRILVEGIIADKFPSKKEFTRLLDELTKLRIDSNKRFEQVDRRFDKLEQEVRDTRVDLEQKIEDTRIGLEQKIEDTRIDLGQKMEDIKNSVNLQVGRFQTRAGKNLEKMVTSTLRLALKRTDIKEKHIELRRMITDEKGIIGPKNREYETDILAIDDKYYLFEIKSVIDYYDVRNFADRGKLFRSLYPDKKIELLLVTLAKTSRYKKWCNEFNVKLF